MNGPWQGGVALAAGLMAASGLSAGAASQPNCSRYQIEGLTTGMTYKTVQRTMKEDGLSTVVFSAGRGEASAIRYSRAYLEFDQRVDRRGSATVVLVRVPTELTPAAVDALVARLGPPDDGASELASGLREGTAVWVDPACGVVLTAYRPPGSWWAGEGGAVLQAETLELARKGGSPATPKLSAILAAKSNPETAPPPPAPALAEAPPPDVETPPAQAPPEEVAAAVAAAVPAEPAADDPTVAAPAGDRDADTQPSGGDVAAIEAAAPAEPPVDVPESLAPPTVAAVPVAPPIDVPEIPPAQRPVAKSVAQWGSPTVIGARTPPSQAPAPRTIKDWRSESAPATATTASAPQSIRSWRYTETPPQRIVAVPPAYPTLAKRQNVSGHVTLAIVVLADGTVGAEPRIVSAVPSGRGFERAAADAVRQWRYQPAMRDGQPVAANLTVGVDFK